MNFMKTLVVFLLIFGCVVLLTYSNKTNANFSSFGFIESQSLMNTKSGIVEKLVKPVGLIKPGNRWIVVTSVSSPTEDVKRLASFSNWNLVVVADTKTPKDWKLDGVHFLSVEMQNNMAFRTIQLLPFKSYTRKNIGYLYAISQGAEWIYDTDDDNKPYGLGLDQFDYDNEVSGVRYQVGKDEQLINKIFNPYRFYGRKEMWPRGFPLEYLKEHTNGKNRTVLCSQMKRSAVQQGLVHHDPDVDAIYRLQHADPQTGLDERFNKFAPPITLAPGTFSPWNSQNTLFHKSAFHTLFLPTTVSFRTTDIWRSYYAQKILHLSGLSVSFTPVNAIQFRNAHNYLKDFEDEKQVYEDAGKIVRIIDSRTCSYPKITECMKELADIFVKENIWGSQDAYLISIFVEDLERIGFEFPQMIDQKTSFSEYVTQANESSRDVNCRRTGLSFEVDYPENNQTPAIQKAENKIKYFGDIVNWCNETGYTNLTNSLPSPNQLAERHANNSVLTTNLENVLIITNNFEWKWAIGLLQRLYEPYFGYLIFCGSFYPENYTMNESNFPPIIESSFNYIHINPAEMHRGYFGYHCMTLVREMKLSNVKGYFMIADDTQFNIWQHIDFNRVFHLHGVGYQNESVWWSYTDYGLNRSENILKFVNSTTNEKVLNTWKHFEEGLRKYGYINQTQTASDDMMLGKSRSVSDFLYVPSSEINYYADLMSIFYKFELFHELAVNKFLRSVSHQTSKQMLDSFNWKENRSNWAQTWNADYIGYHPIKLSSFSAPNQNRTIYCSKLIQTWRDVLFGGSTNYTMKKDTDPDYMNG